MRKLMWFTIGFTLACGLCVYLLDFVRLSPLKVFVLLASVVMGLLGRRYAAGKMAALVLLGCGMGFGWYQLYSANYLSPAAALDGVTQEAVVTVTDYGFETGYGWGVDGSFLMDGKSYQIRVYLDEGAHVEPGMQIEGTFRFRLTTPDSLRGGTSHSGKGIFLLAYQNGEVNCSSGREENFAMWASRLRRQIKDILKAAVPEDTYSFAKALLLGDTTDLRYEVDTQLKVSGIRHVAAVSGLHISILVALVSTVTFRKRFFSAIIGMPLLLVFAGLAGFTPSVNRACIMSALMLLALLLDREYDGLSALAFSVLVMLAVNPLAVSSVSLQLSVASVAGIFLFSGPLGGWLGSLLGNPKGKSLRSRLKRGMIASVSTSLGAMSLAIPLCAWHFSTVSLIGVVTNLLTLWIISFIFYLLMGVCLLYWISRTAAAAMGVLAACMIRYVLFVARAMAAFPLACVYTASVYVTAWLVFVYVLLVLFLLSRKKQPWILGCCGCLGLCLALLCSWSENAQCDTVLTVLDVGQGQCILLQSDGRNFMVDCGGEDDAAAADIGAEALLSRGLNRLDGLIVTHTDRDHAGAVENLRSRITVDMIILPPVHAGISHENAIYADRILELSWGNTQMTVFGENISKSENENSLCILLDTEKCDILITGDRNTQGEKRLLETGRIHDVDVLVAGHHGSGSASSRELLEAVQPEIVCISVGAENIYGHPAPEALERIASVGAEIYRTDLHGTITIRR